MNEALLDSARHVFREYYRCDPSCIAYAPGRVEVLGNHTDYNDGYVLSSAIGQGTWFLAAPAPNAECRVVAGDVRETVVFPLDAPRPDPATAWANYVKGMLAGLSARARLPHGFFGLFLGDVPLGAGLSSSAALEMSSGLALAALYGITIAPLDMARIGQAAEHAFAGVQCGLLDQISSLLGQTDRLVQIDFRSLQVATIPTGAALRFLIVNTGVKHRLVDSQYNRRRAECRRASDHFSATLPGRRISALRDLSSKDWEDFRGGLDDAAARRALHVIGENERVLAGAQALRSGDVAAFGELMFASHESSRVNFENSCPELDFVVDTARATDGVLGARLSGGGFGGGVVVLVRPVAVDAVAIRLCSTYARKFRHACDVLSVRPAAGACVRKEALRPDIG